MLWLPGEVTTDSIGVGVLGVGGNKGAVAVGFSIFRTQVAVVNSHFAAHQVCKRLLSCCRCSLFCGQGAEGMAEI